MSHHRVCKKVGFSALVLQEMFKGVDIGVLQVALCKLIPEYVLLACNLKKKKKILYHFTGKVINHVTYSLKNSLFG